MLTKGRDVAWMRGREGVQNSMISAETICTCPPSGRLDHYFTELVNHS